MARASRSNSVVYEITNFHRREEDRVDSSHFELLKVLGTGNYGKVFLVRKTKGTNIGKPYAMKVLRKASLEADSGWTDEEQKRAKDEAASQQRTERSILEAVQLAPFLVQLHYAFQTDDKLHLILDYVSGGELFHHHALHFAKHKTFPEEDARVYVAEVALALGHLHGIGIIYRDIKLENILLDSEGHVVLTDFGLSKEMWAADDRTNSYVGTVDYMAPELVLGSEATGGYTKAVDWWSFGVLLYELVFGRTPFAPTEEDRRRPEAELTKRQLQRIIREEPAWPDEASPELLSILVELLQKDPEKRLGYGPRGSDDVHSHDFFSAIRWEDVRDKRLVPPFRPALQGELDTSNFDAEFTQMDAVISPSVTRGELFRGFSFVAPSVLYDPSALFPKGAPVDDDSFQAKYTLADRSEALGHGSYSVCKKCVEKSTGKEFAVKIISSRRCTPEREIRILKKCSGQANIISIIDSFKDDMHHYIVMPVMRGGELLDRIRIRKRFTEMEAAKIFKSLIKAVRFLHRNGIVHRDIKPENLLYEHEGDDAQLKIIDFGFAREFTGSQLCKTPALSLGYGAPEVLEVAARFSPSPDKGKKTLSLLSTGGYDKSCDLWSLGVILYAMLAGYPPFHSRKNMTAEAMLERVKGGDFKFPEAEWAGVSAEAKDLVRGLLTVDSSKRLTAEDAAKHPWLAKLRMEKEELGLYDSDLMSPAILTAQSEPPPAAPNLKRKRSLPCIVTETINVVARQVRQGHKAVPGVTDNIGASSLMQRRAKRSRSSASSSSTDPGRLSVDSLPSLASPPEGPRLLESAPPKAAPPSVAALPPFPTVTELKSPPLDDPAEA